MNQPKYIELPGSNGTVSLDCVKWVRRNEHDEISGLYFFLGIGHREHVVHVLYATSEELYAALKTWSKILIDGNDGVARP